MPQQLSKIPMDAMFGGQRPPGAQAAPAGPPPGEGPMHGQPPMQGPGGGGVDPEAFLQLVQLVLQADPELRERVIARLAERQGGMGMDDMPMDDMPPGMPPGPPSGMPPGGPGPAPGPAGPGGGTPFLDKLRQMRG